MMFTTCEKHDFDLKRYRAERDAAVHDLAAEKARNVALSTELEQLKAFQERLKADVRRQALQEASDVCRRGTASGETGWSWRMDCAEEIDALADGEEP